MTTVHYAKSGDLRTLCGLNGYTINKSDGAHDYSHSWVDVTCLKCMSIGVPISLENRRKPQLGLVEPEPPKVKGLDFAVMVEDKWVSTSGLTNVTIAYPDYMQKYIMDDLVKTKGLFGGITEV